MRDFSEELNQARQNEIPCMALRPFNSRPDEKDLMDDVVVKNPLMYRFEMMDDDLAWSCCYFPNGEQVTFWIRATRERGENGRFKARPVLEMSVTEYPPEWLDIDSGELR